MTDDELLEAWQTLDYYDQRAFVELVHYSTCTLDREQLECFADVGFFDMDTLTPTEAGRAAVTKFKPC